MTANIHKIITAQEIDQAQLDRFLRGYFSEQHCNFLRDYGLWHHQSNKHRLIVLNNSEQIVGYCAFIPATIWLLDREIPASFWVDLYVPYKQRGKGIQSLTDQAIREMTGLQLGFPNQFVLPIHKKHGWGIREDYQRMMLPLIPSKVIRLQSMIGRKGVALRSVAQLASPIAWFYRGWLKRYEPTSAQVLEKPEAEALAAIFLRYRDGWVTTNRSADYIRWRYLESPYRSQYTFFVGGTGLYPSLVVVSRTLIRQDRTVTRILDIFGDLEDQQGLSDILRLVIREAVKQGSSQITAIASNPNIMSVLRANGFLANIKFYLRWFSQDPEVMASIGKSRCHWALADSDNDLLD